MKDLPEGLAVSGVMEISRVLGLVQGGQVLDVATGRGGFISTLMRSLGGYASFVGVDIDTEDLKAAEGELTGGPVEFQVMDATSMTFDDGAFDTVSMSNSLHHLARVGEALAEMTRVVRPGGNLILFEMFCDGDQSSAQRNEIAKHHWSARVDNVMGKFHQRTYTREGILSLVEGLDLDSLEVFETSRQLDCLFCEDAPHCEDPLDEMMVTRALADIDEVLERLHGCTDGEVIGPLREEAETLRARIRGTGVLPASSLFLMGSV